MVIVHNQRGFTLLELVTAMAVAGTLAGIAVLGYRQTFEDLLLNQAARQIVADLMTTRARALADNVGRRLVFLPAQDGYQPQRQNGPRYENDGNVIALPAGIDLTDCTASGSAVSFRPRGNAGTFGTITLLNSPGRQRQVIIDIAGRIRVQ